MSAKRRRVPETLRCPCCGEPRLVAAKRSPLSAEALLAEHQGTPWWANIPGWTISLARQGLLVWACDACFRHGRALRARAWLQVYCCDSPRLAYFDIVKTCRACGGQFVFSRLEQRRWCEEFKLPPRAEPVACRACRAAERAVSAANTELAVRLKGLDPRSPTELAEVAALYVTIGSPRKAADFFRRAKNASDDPGEVAELLEKLARVAPPRVAGDSEPG